ncbi:Phosphoribosylformylglycinamidine synthase subunit PurQ [bioreactor metagenome]|uniref:Phosphoribosylformylglycinamidine synthase subunit PurQ n=1 Tax=bioreactor metagenome TaxID=1076179 RepID=A0A645BRP7_9ZZZZ
MAELETKIKKSQIIAVPGGFSAGDEPDGSGKFMAAVFRNPKVRDAVHELLRNRDGLMIGICNGFQALIKTGLLPFGEIGVMTEESATLTNNAIGRHESKMVRTRVASVLSPWLSSCKVDEIYAIPISHGEGRLVATPALLAQLEAAGQIATQYVDLNDEVTMDIDFAPNSSICAIEGITSPDGRVFGKMCHCERIAKNTMRNIPGVVEQPVFAGGVGYFK